MAEAPPKKRARSSACGRCGPCLAPECGLCKPCLDMRKRGGPGTLRKKCVARICAAPVSSDARPPRVTPTPPRSRHRRTRRCRNRARDRRRALEVWNEQQRLRNCVPPRWAPAGERVKAGLQPYPPITVAAAAAPRGARGRGARAAAPAPEPDGRRRARAGAVADGAAPAPEPWRTAPRPRRSRERTGAGAPRRSRRRTTTRPRRRLRRTTTRPRRSPWRTTTRPRTEPEDDAALRATETPFRAALAAHAASVEPRRDGRHGRGLRPAHRRDAGGGDRRVRRGAARRRLRGPVERAPGEGVRYDHWKPDEVRAIVLAESHVFTAPEEQAAKRLSDAAFERLRRDHGYDGPRGYVRLVNCLGYGEQALCADGRAADRGSTQFWQLLAACSRELAPATPATPVVGPGGQLSDVLKLGSPRLEDRLAAKFRVMRDLKARGIWLLDTCVVGWYIPQATYYVRSARNGEVQRKAKERPPKLQDARAGALVGARTKHVVRAAAAAGHLKALIPIGAEVFAAIGLDRLRAAAGAVVPGEAFRRPTPGSGAATGPTTPTSRRSARRARTSRTSRCRARRRPAGPPAAAPAAAPSAVVTPGPAAAAAAAPSAVVTPGKVPKPRGPPLGATWDGARGEWVRAASPPPAPVVEAEPAAADEELTEWRAAVGDEWADWRGCIATVRTTRSMVGCDGGCDNWFHFACVGITRLPRGEFYCEECKAGASQRRLEAAASTPGPKPGAAPTPRPTPDDRRRARTKKSGRRPAAKPRQACSEAAGAADAPCGARASRA